MFKGKSDIELQFFTNVLDLSNDSLAQPQPAMKFIPQAWKKIPKIVENYENSLSLRAIKTIKTCPSFADYFTQGVILPAWCDMAFKYEPDLGKWTCATGTQMSPYEIAIHEGSQMLDHMDYKHRGENAQLVFKLISPWFLKTPKNWSILQLPLYYNADKDWQVMPGIIDTDVYYTLNQQIMYFGNGREVLIKKGEPLVHYIPFERKKIRFTTKLATPEFGTEVVSKSNFIHSMATGGYNALRREFQ